ncbi:MAG: Glycerophosphoryl diester phosphodiesterase [Pedosphaera sp.]|nr:Glycerophosphoryl diester phosphodiesterase [Pedosphaera sp.]
MTTILAHRANLNGPHSVVENSLAACVGALAEGFGLETDLRRDGHGAFYISHDAHPRSVENGLEAYTELFGQFPSAELAINVKELGYEPALVELMNSGRLGKRSFFFDFELLEPATPGAAQRKIKSLVNGGGVRVASRLSDRNETLSQCLSIPAEVVWADEFDGLWMTEKEAAAVRASGRLLYMISPELHGFDLAAMKRRWRDFKSWGVDGVCTDYPLEAREFFDRLI